MTTRYQGQAGVTLYFVVTDPTANNARVTGLTFANFEVDYGRPGSNVVAATPCVTSTPTAAHANWGLFHWFQGIYGLHVHNDVCLAGVERAIVNLRCIGGLTHNVAPLEVELPASNLFTAQATLQQYADAMRTLFKVRDKELGKIIDVMLGFISGANATGTRALPKFEDAMGEGIVLGEVTDVSGKRGTVTINWAAADT